jgi:hypothetical protein
MRRIALCSVLALALVGCVSAPQPTLEVDGYSRIPVPQGCYGGADKHEHNIQLDPELEHELVGLLRDPPIGVVCWHEQRDATLLVTIGSACGPYREAEFQRSAAKWALKDERNVVSECFIRCQRNDPKYCAVLQRQDDAICVVPVA